MTSLPGYDEWKTTQGEWECPACEVVYVGISEGSDDDPWGEYDSAVCHTCAVNRSLSECQCPVCADTDDPWGVEKMTVQEVEE